MCKGFDKTVADEIVTWCMTRPKGGEPRGGPYEEFIDPDRLPKPVYAEWTSEKATDYITAKLEKAVRGKGAGLRSEDPLEVADAVVDLLSQHFVVTEEHGGTLYKVIDRRNRIVQPCYDTKDKAGIQVAYAIKDELREMGLAVSPALGNHYAGLFMSYAERVEAPRMWAMPDDPGYCLGRMLVLPDESVPCPHIMSTVNRCNDPEALMACVWKDYSNRYKGRQSLYLSEKTGESGKSSLFREISKLFELMEAEDGSLVPRPSEKFGGHRLTAAINANILTNSSHASASFEGRRYAVAGDNKSPMVLRTQVVMELTGHDLSLANPKHKPAYSTFFECRLVILGNVEPFITTERHALSRLIWLTLDPLPKDQVVGDWDTFYAAEMPGFLAKCKAAYEAKCEDDYTIKVNAAAEAALARRIEECEGKFSIPFSERFILDPQDEITAPALNKILFDEWKWHEHKVGDFHNWLERTFGIVPVKPGPSQGLVYRGMREQTSYDRLRNRDPQPDVPDLAPDLMADFADDAEFC